ncbi:MAG TPA: DUF2892 domain-containing protein [Bacteroidetes bacterium]|nr:DUF2892 domain-containing protein [Bacteroidota bacterium]
MKKNVGSTDRMIRLIAGVILLGAGYYYQNWWGALGLIPLLTGLLNWCPGYNLFGINTNKEKAS